MRKFNDKRMKEIIKTLDYSYEQFENSLEEANNYIVKFKSKAIPILNTLKENLSESFK